LIKHNEQQTVLGIAVIDYDNLLDFLYEVAVVAQRYKVRLKSDPQIQMLLLIQRMLRGLIFAHM
tara:strand:+ start:140 stop:331 length:192 start_codon:yes stop_codon:yes gene_type:complete